MQIIYLGDLVDVIKIKTVSYWEIPQTNASIISLRVNEVGKFLKCKYKFIFLLSKYQGHVFLYLYI